MAVRMILFDAVGTLIRPREPVAETYHAAARRYGSQWSVPEIARRFPAAMRRHMGVGDEADVPEAVRAPAALDRPPTSEREERRRWQAIVAEVIDDVTSAQDQLFDELWNHFADWRQWEVYPDVREAWESLEQLGYQLGIASNFDGRLPPICRQLEPLSRAAHVFHSAGLGHAKPSLDFFRAIERQLGRPPHELLLVGDDRINDRLGAQAAGWHALLLDRTATTTEPGIVRSLNAVAEWVGVTR